MECFDVSNCVTELKMAQRLGRLKRECQQLRDSPPSGVSCWPEGDSLETFSAGACVFAFFAVLISELMGSQGLLNVDYFLFYLIVIFCDLGYLFQLFTLVLWFQRETEMFLYSKTSSLFLNNFRHNLKIPDSFLA